ncbi:MAG TPA: hypothetical protein VFN39_09240 [Gemmatimonadaceae bacterium]|nr:hypothetical protein [Gemmatimonadaceae bacterium]
MTTVLLLAVVLWLDGWRRVPREALLLRKTGLGGWRVVEPWARLGAFALVALWPPLIVPLVVTTGDTGSAATPWWRRDFAIAVARGRRRLRRTRLQVGALRAIGVLLSGWIVVGIPIATARSGLNGLLLGILGAFCLSTWLAIVAAGTVRELGASWRAALRASAPLVSPFTAVRAPEVVTDAALGGLPALARVAALLDERELGAWLRPHAYDVLHGRAAAGLPAGLARLVAQLPADLLGRSVGAAPSGAEREAGTAYCPRCATTYQESATSCVHCSEVALHCLTAASLPR